MIIKVALAFVCGLLGGLSLASQDMLALAPHPADGRASGDRDELARWHPRFHELCYFQDGENVHNDITARIEALVALLKLEPALTDDLLVKAAVLGAALCVDERIADLYGYFDYRYMVVAVREDLNLYEQAVILVHELRHLDQYSRGFGHSLDYTMKEAARLTLAAEADANALATLYAWRMKARGLPEPWQALGGFENYADIAERFEAQMRAGKGELWALREAFAQWYASQWRTDTYARNAFIRYLGALDETKRVPSYARLSDHHFDELCALPDGRNYGCQLTEVLRGFLRGGP